MMWQNVVDDGVERLATVLSGWHWKPLLSVSCYYEYTSVQIAGNGI
jgi:hypothetical protein